MRRRPLYSACNEDTRSELRALAPAPDDVVVCVAAGGGRALSLLSAGARLLAVDRRAAQLHGLELKAAALDALDYAAMRRFLGVDEAGGDDERLDAWRALRGGLSPAGRRYWDARPGLLRRGVLYAGRTETWLARGALLLRRAGALEWPVRCFAAPDLGSQHEALARAEREVRRGERAFEVLIHPGVMWLATQDPSFLRSSEGPIGRVLYRRFLRFAERRLVRDSFLLHLIYFGRYDPAGALPLWLTREGAARARAHLGRLELVHADLASGAPRGSGGSARVLYSLSDVGCWMGAARFEALVRRLAAASPAGSRFVWRDLAAHRPVPIDTRLRRDDGWSAALERDDASVFYRFHVADIV